MKKVVITGIITGGIVVLFAAFVCWFVEWMPCHFDPIMCKLNDEYPMPWWWYAITLLLSARLAPGIYVLIERRKS